MTDKTVAIEILRQLGGNKFIAMTGAKSFTCDDNSMGFRLPGTMTKDRINYIKITLNGMDTEFIYIWGSKIKTLSTFKGDYCDMIENIVADRTGLATRL